jgi:hypothetical protein
LLKIPESEKPGIYATLICIQIPDFPGAKQTLWLFISNDMNFTTSSPGTNALAWQRGFLLEEARIR